MIGRAQETARAIAPPTPTSDEGGVKTVKFQPSRGRDQVMSSNESKPGGAPANVSWHRVSVTRERRETENGHRSVVLWFTGLSGSGKSTLAHAVEEMLHENGCHTFVFDGDNVRHGLCKDLGFSPQDRHENIRRIGEMAKLFLDAGVISLAAFISPYRVDRAFVRDVVGAKDYLEIYCRCSLEVCEKRDTKGLYRRARAGEIKEFTGISAPYEEPENPDLIVDTGTASLEQCAQKVLDLLVERRLIDASPSPDSAQRGARLSSRGTKT